MVTYANDCAGRFPRADSPPSAWGGVVWNTPTRGPAYGITLPDGLGGRASISSRLYLLVKYAEVGPDLFVGTHVEFAKRAYCSLDDDSIYTMSIILDRGDALGVAPAYSPNLVPRSNRDCLLLRDPLVWPDAQR